MAGQPEEPVQQQGEDRVLSPVYSDEGFLPHDVILMGGEPEEPVQQQGEDGGLSQDVAGSYQAWIAGVFCQCFESGSALKIPYGTVQPLTRRVMDGSNRLIMSNQRYFEIVCFRFPTNVPKKIEYICFWNKIDCQFKTFSFSSQSFWSKRN
jgi:hypothetical protein